MAVDAYTIESMAYLTTGLIDTRGAGSGDLRGSEGRGGPVRVFPSFAPLPPSAALAPADQMDMSIEAAACKVRSRRGGGGMEDQMDMSIEAAACKAHPCASVACVPQ